MTSGLPSNLAPMLATAGPVPTPDEDFAHEVKWDGVRILASVNRGSVRLVTRNNNDVSASYPELQALAAQVGQGSVLLDAEVAAMNGQGRTDFSLIQSRMHVRRPSKALLESTPVQLLIFDLLYVDNQSLLTSTYVERRRRLADLQLRGPCWQTPPAVDGAGAAVLATSREQGLEGIVSKRRTSTYTPGRRSRDWIKTKNVRRSSALVAGWKPGGGGRVGQIGSLLLGVHPSKGDPRLEYAGSVGTGFTQATLQRLQQTLERLHRNDSPFTTSIPRADAKDAVWVQPVLVVEVEYTELTRENRLRHPSYKGLRDDYDPADVVLE